MNFVLELAGFLIFRRSRDSFSSEPIIVDWAYETSCRSIVRQTYRRPHGTKTPAWDSPPAKSSWPHALSRPWAASIPNMSLWTRERSFEFKSVTMSWGCDSYKRALDLARDQRNCHRHINIIITRVLFSFSYQTRTREPLLWNNWNLQSQNCLDESNLLPAFWQCRWNSRGAKCQDQEGPQHTRGWKSWDALTLRQWLILTVHITGMHPISCGSVKWRSLFNIGGSISEDQVQLARERETSRLSRWSTDWANRVSRHEDSRSTWLARSGCRQWLHNLISSSGSKQSKALSTPHNVQLISHSLEHFPRDIINILTEPTSSPKQHTSMHGKATTKVLSIRWHLAHVFDAIDRHWPIRTIFRCYFGARVHWIDVLKNRVCSCA